MRKTKTLAEKLRTFCKDCELDPKTCGRNPLDCMKEEEARLYFQLYETINNELHEVS